MSLRLREDNVLRLRFVYEDGDFEDLDSGEVNVILVEECDLNEKKEKLDKLLPIKDVNGGM